MSKNSRKRDPVTLVSNTNKSKIEKYGLEEMTIKLREEGKTYEEIAKELNISGKVPKDDDINLWVVERYLKKIPEVKRNLIQQDRRRLLKVVNSQIDIIEETSVLYQKTKNLLTMMEEQSMETGLLPSAKSYKALASEMRELLKQMTEIQKEVNNFDNVKKFMEIVLETVQEHAPTAMPDILDKLKANKHNSWLINTSRMEETPLD